MGKELQRILRSVSVSLLRPVENGVVVIQVIKYVASPKF